MLDLSPVTFRLTSLLYPFYRLGERLSQGLRRRVTEAGWFMLATTFVLGLSGLDTNWSAHFRIFSIMLTVLFLAWMALLWSRRPPLRVKRHCPRFATAGTPLRYPVTITNTADRGWRGISVCDALADPIPTKTEFVNRSEPRERERNLFDRTFVYYRWMWLVENRRVAVSVPSEPIDFSPSEQKRVLLEIIPRRRGLLPLQRVRVINRDPFGFFRRWRRLPAATESLLVLPKRYPLPTLHMPGRRRVEEHAAGVATTNLGQSEEFIGLRDYRAGDPRRHIHWRSWARLNRPVVKEFEDETVPRYALILDTLLDPDQDLEIFEEAVAVAASFVSTVQTRESLLDLLFVADQAYAFHMGGPGAQRASEKMLEVLATVQPSTEKRVLKMLERSIERRSGSLSAAVLVFTEWCEERRNMVERLRAHGVPCQCLVIVPDERPPEPGVLFLPLGAVGEGLMMLEAAQEARIPA